MWLDGNMGELLYTSSLQPSSCRDKTEKYEEYKSPYFLIKMSCQA